MCRARHERPPHGRRCPGHADPRCRELANIRQRLGRYDRACRTANDAQDWKRLDHYVALLDRDVAALARLTQDRAPAASPPPSRAAEFTPDVTWQWTDDQLMDAFAELRDDLAAHEQIVETLAWREDLARQRDADIAAWEAQKERERRDRAAAELAAIEDASPLTNPARRPGRKLTAEQACREEYDSYLYTHYMQAESDCRGQLLNRDGLAAGIDPAELFSGPASRARKYASEELRTWWGRHGRTTYAEWKYSWHGRESDKEAARTAKAQSLGEVTA
ncbi:hypothetical protein [Lentzea terrae]|uniref:hypothetical protein n=1 Tax=Lentzea terrae TaxID=2200761 RepID=UPI000DD2F428|nr:hypothetical protein [Lentzea terrae]